MEKEEKIFVFAYGSNMYSKRIITRIKSANYFGVGSLSNHSLKFHKKSQDGSGKADCFFTGNKKDKVCGVVYQIDKSDKQELDKYEGLNNGYLEKIEPINLTNSTTVNARLYYADIKFIDYSLKPYKWYLDLVITGLKENCINLNYLHEINKIDFQIDEKKDRKSRLEAINILPNEIDAKMGSNWTINNWKELRKELRKDLKYNENWNQGLIYFENRIQTRYIKPIKKIENDYKGSGFAIVSTLCIIIELIAAFKFGKIHNINKRGELPKYEYKESDKFYKIFLSNANGFNDYFSSINGKKPILCVDDFYKNVRCALIHEACTKNNWIINTKYHSEIIDKNKPFQIDNNFKKIINRNSLLVLLENLISDYINEVKSGDNIIREYFARKMDHICEITPDDSSWWIDKQNPKKN